MNKSLGVFFAATVMNSGTALANTCGELSLGDESLRALLAAPAAARPVLLDLLQAQLNSTPEARTSLATLLGTQLDRALVVREPADFRVRLKQELAPVCDLAERLAATPSERRTGAADQTATDMYVLATMGADADQNTSQLLESLSAAGQKALQGEGSRSGEDAPPPHTSESRTFQRDADLHSGLFDTRQRVGRCVTEDTPTGICTQIQTDINKVCGDITQPISLACSERLFADLSERFAILEKAHERAAAVSADSELTQGLARDLNRTRPMFHRAASIEAHRIASYGLYAGPSFQLQHDGEWKGGTEILFQQQTEIFPKGGLKCPKGVGLIWCRGYFEASFATPDEFASEVESETALPTDVFDSKGRLRVEGGWIGHLNDWMGIQLGGGFASPLSDSLDFSRAEFRGKLGVHLQTLHNDGMLGQLGFGVVHDRSRVFMRGTDDPETAEVELPVPVESFDRFYIDATALFPKLELGGWRLAARLSGDWPIDGNEQADVRVSVLFYYPFNSWLETFKPTLRATQN